MAIKARDQIKWTDNDKTLELEADTGEAFIVKDIRCFPVSGGYLTVSIDKTTVGYFRIDNGNLGNHLHFMLADDVKLTLLGYLWSKGIFKGYPVGEGQKLVLSTNSNTSMVIQYDIYEPGDISPDMENGSEAKEYLLINYGRKAASGSLTDGDNELVYSILPSEFPDFPFGGDVPAKTAIEIYGILASDVGKTSGGGANKQKTAYIKLVKEREVLFDEDKRGIIMYGYCSTGDGTQIGAGNTVVGNYSDTDRRLPLMFSTPLRFESGEELSVILSTIVLTGSINIPVDLGEIAFIEKVIRTG